jgi:phage pi2 protein 07
MATTAIEAKNNLEMEFGNGNVVYYPKEIRWVFKVPSATPPGGK